MNRAQFQRTWTEISFCSSLIFIDLLFWQICISNCFPQELEQQFEKERLSLEEQKTMLRQQLDELKEELTSKLTAANEEVEDTEL